jgi:hypothetical protein
MEELITYIERNAAAARQDLASAFSGLKSATSADIHSLEVKLEESNRERDIQFDEIKAKLDDLMDHFGVKRRERAGGEPGSADP